MFFSRIWKVGIFPKHGLQDLVFTLYFIFSPPQAAAPNTISFRFWHFWEISWIHTTEFSGRRKIVPENSDLHVVPEKNTDSKLLSCQAVQLRCWFIQHRIPIQRLNQGFDFTFAILIWERLRSERCGGQKVLEEPVLRHIEKWFGEADSHRGR